jgi:hypothetical protein
MRDSVRQALFQFVNLFSIDAAAGATATKFLPKTFGYFMGDCARGIQNTINKEIAQTSDPAAKTSWQYWLVN